MAVAEDVWLVDGHSSEPAAVEGAQLVSEGGGFRGSTADGAPVVMAAMTKVLWQKLVGWQG